MGLISNTVKTVGTGIGKVGEGFGHGANGVIARSTAQFSGNMASNIAMGSRNCPIITECKDIAQGVA